MNTGLMSARFKYTITDFAILFMGYKDKFAQDT